MSAQQAQMGLDVLMSLGSSWVQGEMIDAQNTVNAANVAAENLMRKANNELAAKQGSLNRYNQSVSNQRVADQAGAAKDAAMTNYLRMQDAAASGDFETQIQMAEAEGRRLAASALSGIQGGVVDMVASTSALRTARIKQNAAEKLKQLGSDAATQQGAIMRAGWESLDTDSVVDNIDQSISVFSAQVKGSNFLGDVLGGLSKNPKNTANVFNFGRQQSPDFLGIGSDPAYRPSSDSRDIPWHN